MTQPITIGSVTLPSGLRWIDEFGPGSDLIGQVETISCTGAIIIQASAQQAGRALTLQTIDDGGGQYGPLLTRAQVVALKALADVAGAVYSVTLNDGRTFNAMFTRKNGPAVQSDQAVYFDAPSDTDWHTATIRMILV